jgi:hypothetical protein
MRPGAGHGWGRRGGIGPQASIQQIFRGDGLLQVAVAMDHTLTRQWKSRQPNVLREL